MEYIVLKGDSLWGIAQRQLGNGLLYRDIAKDNNIKNNYILPGLKLLIKNNFQPEQFENNTYTVQNGDTLYRIALNNNTSPEYIAQINNISDPSKIYIGLNLKLPKDILYTPKLRSIKEISEIENNLNKKDNLNIINTYHSQKNTGEYYLIDDKKNDKLSVYRNGHLIKSYKAIHGKNKNSDAMTITNTDVNGNIINLSGNLSTPAGLFFLNKSVDKDGMPTFIRSKQNGENIPSSLHVRTITDGANTNGCTGISAESANDLLKYVGKNTKIYILPVDNRNKFFIRNGEIQFKSNIPIRTGGTDRTVNGKQQHSKWDLGLLTNYNTLVFTPIARIKYATAGLSDENKLIIDSFCKSLIINKKNLQKDLGINNDTYTQLAKYSLGILGVETGFGNENNVFGNFFRAVAKTFKKNHSGPDYKSKYNLYGMREDYRSIGLTLIRYSFLSLKEKDLFKKYGITKDSLVNSPHKAAIATMIKLATEFKNLGNNIDRSVRSWNRKPSYLSQVQLNAKRFNIFLNY